jgi:hypothetical protein
MLGIGLSSQLIRPGFALQGHGSDPNHVVLTVTDSNVWGGASGYTYTFKRQPNERTDADAANVGEGKNFTGRVLEVVLGTVGKGKPERPSRTQSRRSKPATTARERPNRPERCRYHAPGLARQSLDCLTSGESYLFDVESVLYLAKHDVVDAALVSQSDNSGAFAREKCEAQCGVLLVVPLCRLVVVIFTIRVQNMQEFLVFKPQPVDDLGVGAEIEGELGHRG